MADRRCFHRKIVESDQFYMLPATAQSLYLHLCMAADDDGFLNCASSIAARSRAGKAALKQLVTGRFLLKFGDIYVIKHWRISNTLKNDRLKEPAYPAIAAAVWVRQNRSYTDHPVPGCRTLLEIKTGVPLESDLDSILDSNLDSILESQQKRTEQKEKEQKGMEGNGALQAVFEQLWSAYPLLRRGVKGEARRAFWLTVLPDGDPEAVLANLDAWKISEQWQKDGGQYIPYLSNWLERGSWQIKPPRKEGVIRGASGVLGEAELEAIRSVMAEETD